MKFKYSKPQNILKDVREKGDIDLLNQANYIRQRKAEIEEWFDQKDIRIRNSEVSDIESILRVSQRAYHDSEISDQINAYDLFQSITYSYGLVLCTKEIPEKIVGCIFNFVFHINNDKICNSRRFAIDPDYQKSELGKHFAEYNQLLAKEIYGSRIQTGIIECTNFPSTYLMLNKMGGVAERLIENIANRFFVYSFVVPLNMDNWKQMEVVQDRLADYLTSLQEIKDYILFRYDDRKMSTQVCGNSGFKIAAALIAGKHIEHNSLIAFSNEMLNIELQQEAFNGENRNP